MQEKYVSDCMIVFANTELVPKYNTGHCKHKLVACNLVRSHMKVIMKVRKRT